MRCLIAVLMVLVVTVTAFTTDVCKMKIEVGRCRAAFPRYGFSTEEGKCKQFIYGGCRGNENNFRTLEECNKRCPPRNRG